MKNPEFVSLLDNVFQQVVDYFERTLPSLSDNIKEVRFYSLCCGAMLALKASLPDSDFDAIFCSSYFSFKCDEYFGGKKSE